jgi:hypothetical protein
VLGASLTRTLEAELNATPPLQPALFSELEKEQLSRNRDSLRARAEAIPGESERGGGDSEAVCLAVTADVSGGGDVVGALKFKRSRQRVKPEALSI